jgi:hypothetical protein
MNRRDILECIVNVEYLLWHESNAARREEYDRLLQAFRRELWELEGRPAELTPIWENPSRRAA